MRPGLPNPQIAREDAVDMEEELALRPKISSSMVKTVNGISTGNAYTNSFRSSQRRKRKASSLEEDEQTMTGRDTFEVQAVVPPSIFENNCELKLLSEHLQASPSLASDADGQTLAQKTVEERLKPAIVYSTRPVQSTAHPSKASSSDSMQPSREPQPAAQGDPTKAETNGSDNSFTSEHAADSETDQRHRINDSIAVAADKISDRPSIMSTLDTRAYCRPRYGKVKENTGFPEVAAFLPRSSRNLGENLPARPIGSYASFTQTVIGQANRVATRWKGQPPPFFIRDPAVPD